MNAVTAAIDDLLNAHPLLYTCEVGGELEEIGAPVYRAIASAGEQRPDIYVVYYLTSPLGRSERVSGSMALGTYSLQTLCVGTDDSECRWAMQNVHEALERKRLVIPGRRGSAIRHGSNALVTTNTGINPPAVTCSDTWRFAIS